MNCKNVERYIIDYLDGRLPAATQRAIESHVQQCATCQALIAQEKQISEQLHQLPAMKCPERITERVFNIIKKEHVQKSWHEYIRDWIPEWRSWKLRIGFSLAVIILITIISYPNKEKLENDDIEYTAEEIEQAKKDVELALAYLNHVTKKTEAVLEEQLLVQPIIKPIKSTVVKAFKPLLDGGKS